MVKFDIIASEKIGEVQMSVEAIFDEESTNSTTIVLAIQTIAKVFSSVVSARLNVGIEEISVSQNSINILLRFGRNEEAENVMSVESLGRIRSNFVFYLFACIDEVAPFESVPFPSSYRYFLNLPETLASEYGWV